MDRRIVARRGAAILTGVAMLIGVGGAARATDRQVVADVKCVVVGLRMMQMTAPQQQGAGTMIALYYLGRLDSRVPDAEADELIESEAEKMAAAEFHANAVRCGKVFALRGEKIQKISADLSRKTQGRAAPK